MLAELRLESYRGSIGGIKFCIYQSFSVIVKGMSSKLRSVMLRSDQLKAIHSKGDISKQGTIKDIKVPRCKLSDIKVPKMKLSDIPGPGTLADVPGISTLKKEVSQ